MTRGPIDPGSTSVPLRLPAPDAAMLTRRAIEAAEALCAYRVTATDDDEGPAASWLLDQRREEARGALQILGATLEDRDDPGRRDIAWACAYSVANLDATPDDLADFEDWCRDVAAERDTLPPSGAAREAE